MQEIPKEASACELGQEKYHVAIIFSAILWQCFFMGAIGVTFCGSSLLSGIIIATLLPVTESLAVLFYHEKFHAEKAISLVLSLWGFFSYFYGELQQKKKKKKKHYTRKFCTFKNHDASEHSLSLLIIETQQNLKTNNHASELRMFA